MSVFGFVVVGLILAALLYGIMIYNNLVQLKHGVAQAWANIDVLLKQRHDELPKLIETCKQYMQHERGVLESVAVARASVFKARAAGDVKALGGAEAQLQAGLGNLFAVAENYPALKADETFRNLQLRITQLETQISDRREFYNDSVNANNVRIEQFPDVFVARLLNFGERPLLKFSKVELADVNVKTLFN